MRDGKLKELEKIYRVKGKKFLFKVETSSDTRQYMKYEQLRNRIWGDPKDNLAGLRNMKCENYFQEGSSLFIGVFTEDEKGNFKEDSEYLVGFSYGFVGVNNNQIGFRNVDNLLFYSQYTGVREDFQNLGLAVLIKQFQKEKLLEIFGIQTISCTYDPLSGINAYRNIHQLGMDVNQYKKGDTGVFGGLLNRMDIPCDRFYVWWDLRKKIRRPEYDLGYLFKSGRLALSSEVVEVKGKSGQVKLEAVKEINLNTDWEFLLVEIPYDYYLMLKETDVSDSKVKNLPLDWRMKTREVFQVLFHRGYKIIDFRWLKKDRRKRDFYILIKERSSDGNTQNTD